MKKLFCKMFYLGCIVSVMMCFVSCFDDDGTDYPSLITDLVVAETNSSGKLAKITLDNGKSYDIGSVEVNFGVADTLYRCIASYALTETSMKLYSVANIYSHKPVPLAKFLEEYGEDNLPRDPVNLISMWKSGGYINIQIGVLTSGSKYHAYAFCEEEKGKYSLLHQRPLNDAESYTDVVFLSMPIPEGLQTITFSVNTYEGVRTNTF